jgi:hypothetical protein
MARTSVVPQPTLVAETSGREKSASATGRAFREDDSGAGGTPTALQPDLSMPISTPEYLNT